MRRVSRVRVRRGAGWVTSRVRLVRRRGRRAGPNCEGSGWEGSGWEDRAREGALGEFCAVGTSEGVAARLAATRAELRVARVSWTSSRVRRLLEGRGAGLGLTLWLAERGAVGGAAILLAVREEDATGAGATGWERRPRASAAAAAWARARDMGFGRAGRFTGLCGRAWGKEGRSEGCEAEELCGSVDGEGPGTDGRGKGGDGVASEGSLSSRFTSTSSSCSSSAASRASCAARIALNRSRSAILSLRMAESRRRLSSKSIGYVSSCGGEGFLCVRLAL